MVEPALPVQHAARRERLADTHLSQLIEANTEVVELVDTHVSGACVARHEGSSPSFGTWTCVSQDMGVRACLPLLEAKRAARQVPPSD